VSSELERAARAQAVLENPEFQAACDDIERGIVDRWKSCSISDTEAQTYLKLMLKVHGDFVGTLKRRMVDGKMAEIKIERESRLTKFFQR